MVKQTQKSENAIAEINRVKYVGAEAFGIQLESLPREYHTPQIIKKILIIRELSKERFYHSSLNNK